MATAQSPEIPSSSANRILGSPAGSKTPDSPTRCRSPGSPIGDDACPICLGSFTDKCAAGSCLHNFCLVCLKEWAKQRPVCPLCKQSFSKILYDIKSETDYKEWKVPVLYPNDLNELGRVELGFRQYFDLADRTFFSYRSTLTRSSRLRTNPTFIAPHNLDSLPTVSRRRQQHQQHDSMYNDRGSSLFRLSVYTNNIWIQPISDITGRYRESNPHLYREQPALTHRLVPWVNRELAAMISASRIGVVLSDIMDLIERYPINSREFRRALRPHLGSWTRHFVHEFYHFARSPYDMIGHDNAAQYIPRYDDDDTDREDDSEDPDDEVIEIESDGVVVESEPLDLTSGVVAREETIGNDGSVFISSDSDNSLSISRDFINNSSYSMGRNLNIDDVIDLEIHPHLSGSDNKSGCSKNSSPATRLFENRAHSLSNLEEPGPSGISSNGSLNVKKEKEQRETSDSDDCLIVNILKPKKERTPELIKLSSESDNGGKCKTSNKAHWKKKMSKQLENKDKSKYSKGRKKPRIDRTSFSLHFSGTLNCQHGEDHTYCTESASPCNPGSTRTESEEDNVEHRVNLGTRGLTLNRNTRQRYNKIYSDSDSDSEEERKNHTKSYYKSKHRRSSRSRSFSPTESSKKLRKDSKSKIKSSSKNNNKSKSCSKDAKKLIPSSSRKRRLSSISERRPSKKYNKKCKRYSSSSSSSYSSSSYDSSTSTSSSTSSSSSSSASSMNESFTSKAKFSSASSNSLYSSSSSETNSSNSGSEYMNTPQPAKKKRNKYSGKGSKKLPLKRKTDDKKNFSKNNNKLTSKHNKKSKK